MAEDDRSLAVLVAGQPGLARDVVEQLLHEVGMHMLDLTRDDVEPIDVVVLIDPLPHDWAVADNTAVPCVFVASEPLSTRAVADAIRRGADAVVDETMGIDALLETIETAARAGTALTPKQARTLIDDLRGHVLRGGEAAPHLSPREQDVLRSLALGQSVSQIAGELDLSSKTIKNVQSRLRLKLGVTNRREIVARAHALGLLPDNWAEQTGRRE